MLKTPMATAYCHTPRQQNTDLQFNHSISNVYNFLLEVHKEKNIDVNKATITIASAFIWPLNIAVDFDV